jgi:hypothetical protein
MAAHDEFLAQFKALNQNDKVQILAYLLYDISIQGRCGYVEAGNPYIEAAEHLRVVNEPVHLLSEYMLVCTGAKHPDRWYPVDLTFTMLEEKLQQADMSLPRSLDVAYDKFTKWSAEW